MIYTFLYAKTMLGELIAKWKMFSCVSAFHQTVFNNLIVKNIKNKYM